MPCSTVDPLSGICLDVPALDPALCATFTDPTFCAAVAGAGAGADAGAPANIFNCVQGCLTRNCGITPVQCGLLACGGTDPTLYKSCTDACSTSCGGTAPGPGPGPGGTAVPGDICLGPFGLLGCTVSGVAQDIAKGGQIAGGLLQGVTKNLNLILLLLVGLVALQAFKDVKAL